MKETYMEPIKLKNKKLEDEYFKILAMWKKASKDNAYNTKQLALLFSTLEKAFKDVGYIFGDKEDPKA